MTEIMRNRMRSEPYESPQIPNRAHTRGNIGTHCFSFRGRLGSSVALTTSPYQSTTRRQDVHACNVQRRHLARMRHHRRGNCMTNGHAQTRSKPPCCCRNLPAAELFPAQQPKQQRPKPAQKNTPKSLPPASRVRACPLRAKVRGVGTGLQLVWQEIATTQRQR